eukprot:CAMPEP_0170158234 /NCGR_PEP_ID=MMETSP0033_2-20121228/67838_1 /TAXON_ID=195969 /ORGANISM="Dolichomastix tenuilepis, Strain CCMP3274" /LENGTH=98 /DNA_ID=CAMNT_0010395659 /DNA_START=41 /DNA_END=334 /DNA_ORIENTATION=+
MISQNHHHAPSARRGQVSSRAQIKIIDLGLAKVESASASSADINLCTTTAAHAIVGTAAYLAPEQIDSSTWGAIGPGTDLWALGVVLFESMAGKRPFE